MFRARSIEQAREEWRKLFTLCFEGIIPTLSITANIAVVVALNMTCSVTPSVTFGIALGIARFIAPIVGFGDLLLCVAST